MDSARTQLINNGINQRLCHRPRRSLRPRWAAALTYIAIESELRNDQYGCPTVLNRGLILENAQLSDLTSQGLRILDRVIMSHSNEDNGTRTVKGSNNLAIDRH